MTGVVRVNKLEGRSTAASLDVTGEANSTTTNLQQGLSKAWFHYNQSAGSEAIRDSFNQSSITDNSTGVYTNTFTNNMNNAFYNVTGGTRGNRSQFSTNTGATTGRGYRTADSNNAVNDADSNCWTTMGDLA